MPDGSEQPENISRDLGLMLFDLDYGASNIPRFFEARLDDGILRVPPQLYERRDT